jgi:hypothetical protein
MTGNSKELEQASAAKVYSISALFVHFSTARQQRKVIGANNMTKIPLKD